MLQRRPRGLASVVPSGLVRSHRHAGTMSTGISAPRPPVLPNDDGMGAVAVFATAATSPLLSAPRSTIPSPSLHKGVVVDGQNVGCAYGGNGSRFRARGVELVLDFYTRQGRPAVALLPQAKVDGRPNIRNDRIADDPGLLLRLHEAGRVSFTPAGSHDDYFLLQYAMVRGLDLISNDRFNKEISRQETPERAQALRQFLDNHLIPYTFVQGEFVPNPNPARLGETGHASRKARA